MKNLTRWCLILALLFAPLASRAAAATVLDSIYGSLADLEAAAGRYQEIAGSGGWPSIADGPVLRPGDRDARVADLRDRLAVEGDLAAGESADAAAEPELYSDAVAAAVERFQRRYHLRVDGIVGAGTLQALGVSAEERLAQLEAAIETRRALAERGGLIAPQESPAILINLPEYRLHVVEEGRSTLAMDVAIGAAGWKTPLLREQMETVIINPYWYVPIEIVAAEIAPNVERDPAYLESKGLEVARSAQPDAEIVDPGDVDWSEVDASDPESFPYFLRHPPGPRNPLGRIKFRLPNQESIYLHDTPADEVFDDPKRAVSHGCIRLERPLELAEVVVGEVEGWDGEKLRAALDDGIHRHLPLDNHIAVDSIYLVAWADGDGTVHFTDTPYGLAGPEQVLRDPAEGAGGNAATSTTRAGG